MSSRRCNGFNFKLQASNDFHILNWNSPIPELCHYVPFVLLDSETSQAQYCCYHTVFVWSGWQSGLPLLVCRSTPTHFTVMGLIWSLSMSVCLSTFLSASLPVCLPVCLSVCMSVCMSVCLSVWRYCADFTQTYKFMVSMVFNICPVQSIFLRSCAMLAMKAKYPWHK